eukprot:979999-Amorphochlora_amoeboformis.AAC.1
MSQLVIYRCHIIKLRVSPYLVTSLDPVKRLMETSDKKVARGGAGGAGNGGSRGNDGTTLSFNTGRISFFLFPPDSCKKM